MCYIGDGDNMANSLIVGGLKVGMKVSVATPENYEPDPEVLAFAKEYDTFTLTHDPKEAIQDADVVITDEICQRKCNGAALSAGLPRTGNYRRSV